MVLHSQHRCVYNYSESSEYGVAEPKSVKGVPWGDPLRCRRAGIYISPYSITVHRD
jgi:hypothetical protein